VLKSLNTTKLVSAAILSAVLFGCGGTKPPVRQETGEISIVTATQTSARYLALAADTQDRENRDKYLLLAAHAYLNEDNAPAAAKLLASIQAKLTPNPSLLAEHKYLSALAQEKQGQYQTALEILNYPANWRLAQWQLVAYHQLRAKLFELTQEPIAQVRELSLLSQQLPPAQASAINDTIWHTLQPLQEETLESLARNTADPVFTGWLQLTYIAKRYGADPNQLVRYLGQWQAQHPNHPAAQKLPPDLDRALNAKPYRPKNIAVLLPLTGANATVANAVRQGIIASYLAEPNEQTELNFFDTAEDVTQAYQQALAGGSDFIIGPLLQEEINRLQASLANTATASTAANAPVNAPVNTRVPQLYLNQADKFVPDLNTFYFSLSPQQEASDAANYLHTKGVVTPLLLVSNDAVGQRMAESFAQTWKRLTGNITEIHYYDAGDRMKLAVQEALGVKDSQARIARIKELLGNKIQADFRSRSDIDALYMISAPQDLTLLKPFIDVNLSVFAEPVPLYTSSRARMAEDTQQSSGEFNNLTISDIPWLMQVTDENRLVRELWPSWNNSQKRLYIMGYDALQLVTKLAQMRAFPGYQFGGRSGALSLSADGVISRQLSWGKYQRGSLRQQQ
jgi:uncharacterized protein